MADDTIPMTPEEGAPSVPTAPSQAAALTFQPPQDYDPNMIGPGGVVDPSTGTPPMALVATPQAQQPPPTAEHHLSWIGRVLDKVGSILGGDETYRIKKQPDGSFAISQDPSTTGEKWGRIAAAALGGAAQGLANSQGPGGFARAASAGIQYGMQQPQQQMQQQEQTVDFQNKQLLAKANRIQLTQQAYLNAQHLKLNNIALDEATQRGLNSYADLLNRHGVDYGTIDPSDPNSAMNLAKQKPGAMDDFLGKGNRVMRFVMESDHKMHMIGTDQDWEKRRNVDPIIMPTEGTDKNGKPTLIFDPKNTIPVGADLQENINNAITAIQTRHYANLKSWSESEKAQREAPDKLLTNPLEMQNALEHTTDPVERQRLQSALDADQRRRVQIAQNSRPQLPGLLPGAGAAATGGTTGEDYLKAAVEPSMWNQVRSIANGDVKMPTAGNRGANQALRNAVMNYDPTFTDARYTTKQNFKDAKDADRLQQLSTALEHLERATQNADYNPALPFSEKAVAYKEDIKHFTQESGNYIKGGVLTQGEYEDLMKGATSLVPSVRQHALAEKANLLGGKVRASFQKYRAGAGKDLPVGEFFDPDTQSRLTRYGLTTGAAPGAAPAAAAPAAAPKEPPAPTGATITYHDQKDGHLLGWAVGGKFVPYTPPGR